MCVIVGGALLGFFLAVSPSGREALAAAESVGVTFVPGEDFFLRAEEGGAAARLAFSFAAPAEIEEGVALLAGALAVAA